ncbi:RCC1/BLIP-II [Phellopilus nigrolimitatus]|nr:RCC1/BLIP-II [Phellopilus nigrolimitatus]
MLRQSCRAAHLRRKQIAPRVRRAHVSTDSSSAGSSWRDRNASEKLGPVALVIGATVLSYSYAKARPVRNDAIVEPSIEKRDRRTSTRPGLGLDSEHLSTVAWGSNKDGLISPTTPESDSFRVPSNVPWLKDVALRDLALHERHGACVDARGDLYQWDKETQGPILSLMGSVQATPSRVFALSASGKIYTLSVDTKTWKEKSGELSSSSSSWSLLRWGSSKEQDRDYVELGTDQKLGRSEKFISISAGNEHLLALTSSGRTFAHPISKNANTHGQLGVSVELIPRAILDPYANVSLRPRFRKQPTAGLDDTSIRFCDRLYEVPSLRGIKVAQAVAGARSSFVRTEIEGRVLAWGANEYGQLGLGSTLTVDTITIPTEVVFSKSASANTRSKCVNINAGGDLTFFTVERTDGSFMPSTELLSCGMGQWGGLGNGLYSTAQGNPSRVKAVSGLLEFSEKTQNLQAIVPYALSVSPTGHVLLTLDTLARAGSGAPQGSGRDLLVWGANREYQLGNGKRASLATPAALELPGLPSGAGMASAGEGKSGDSEKGRLMMSQRQAKEVKDLQGRRWKTNVDVEQCAVAGWGSSLIYWKICKK